MQSQLKSNANVGQAAGNPEMLKELTLSHTHQDISIRNQKDKSRKETDTCSL